MKKIFGITESGDAHFYEIEINGMEEFITSLSDKLNYGTHVKTLCNFYSHNVHDYGIYQSDINNGLCEVTKSKVLQRSKKNMNDSDDIVGFGIVEFDLEYKSQIAKTLGEMFCSKNRFVDFSKLVHMSNYFDNVKEGFSNSDRLLRKEKIYLNDVEKRIAKEYFLRIIRILSKKIDFKYIGTISKDALDNPNMKFMYKMAVKNSDLNDNQNFEYITNLISNVDNVKLLKRQ